MRPGVPDALCCAADVLAAEDGALRTPLPALHDEEGQALPEGLPEVIDAHVHLFALPVFQRIWQWFEHYGWPIRYKMSAPEIPEFLFSRGVSRMVALHYAHRPGIARSMNRFMAELVADRPNICGSATVLPGEPEAAAILAEGLSMGLRAVKIHCHVQCMAPDAPEMDAVYRLCAETGTPLVMHAGREPKSPAYRVDPHSICAADRVERVLLRYPTLRLVVPHLGADEFEDYHRMVLEYDNLWLDTTMVLAKYLPANPDPAMWLDRPERILYGTDFPILPYAWDREVKQLLTHTLTEEQLTSILGGTAQSLFFS